MHRSEYVTPICQLSLLVFHRHCSESSHNSVRSVPPVYKLSVTPTYQIHGSVSMVWWDYNLHAAYMQIVIVVVSGIKL